MKSKRNISKAILERICLFCEISFVLRRLHSFFVCGRFGSSTAVLHTRTKSALKYRKVASSNMSRLEAHAGFFRVLMKGIFDPYVLWPFDKKLIS